MIYTVEIDKTIAGQWVPDPAISSSTVRGDSVWDVIARTIQRRRLSEDGTWRILIWKGRSTRTKPLIRYAGGDVGIVRRGGHPVRFAPRPRRYELRHQATGSYPVVSVIEFDESQIEAARAELAQHPDWRASTLIHDDYNGHKIVVPGLVTRLDRP